MNIFLRLSAIIEEMNLGIIELAESLAVIVAALVAIWGINTWRREKKYELAEDVLASFYEAKDKISIIRMPISFEEETKNRERDSSESPDQAKTLDRAYATIKRYNDNLEFFSKLFARRYRFRIRFGQDKEKPFYDLSKLIAEILTAIRMLGYLWNRQTQTHLRMKEGEAEKLIEDIEKYEAIIWEYMKEPDPINERVEEIISEIENTCGKVLRLKRSWISKIFGRKQK